MIVDNSTIPSLRGIDSRDAIRLLTAVGSAIQTAEQVGSVFDASTLDESARQAFKEVVQKLSKRGSGAPGTGQILDRITRELTTLMIGKQPDRVLDRLGNRGALRPSEYKVQIELSEDFLRRSRLRRSHIEDAIHRAARVLHLKDGDWGVPGVVPEQLVSMFVSPVNSSKAGRFVLIVVAFRSGTTVRVVAAFRIQDRFFPFIEELAPLELLGAFCDRYGVSWMLEDDSRVSVLHNVRREARRLENGEIVIDLPGKVWLGAPDVSARFPHVSATENMVLAFPDGLFKAGAQPTIPLPAPVVITLGFAVAEEPYLVDLDVLLGPS